LLRHPTGDSQHRRGGVHGPIIVCRLERGLVIHDGADNFIHHGVDIVFDDRAADDRGEPDDDRDCEPHHAPVHRSECL
jgi:hypothetical protein